MSSPLFGINGGITRLTVEYLSPGEAAICSKLAPGSLMKVCARNTPESDEFLACAKYGWIEMIKNHDWRPVAHVPLDNTLWSMENKMASLASKNKHLRALMIIIERNYYLTDYAIAHGFITAIRKNISERLNDNDTRIAIAARQIYVIREARRLRHPHELPKFYELVRDHAIECKQKEIKRLANKWNKKHQNP